MDKVGLRKRMLAKRDSLAKEEIIERSRKIRNNVNTYEPFKNANRVLLYFEKGSEVGLSPLLDNNKMFYLPKIIGERIIPIRFSEFDNLILNKFGIKEPEGDVDKTDIDLCLVPGICFDRKGNRIGYGKGYYDKFLREFKGLKIGVCYDFQLVDVIPAKSHDVRMNVIITEKGVYDNRR